MEEQRNTAKLDRYLSSFDVWALSVGCIIGWGAFVMPGTTFLPVAGPAGTLIAMACSAAIMLIIGVNYSSLMSRQPGVGGVYSYTKEVFGRDHAFLSSRFLCLAYLSLIPQNATALGVMCRVLFSDAMQWGFHYRIAGYDVYAGEAAVGVLALLLIGWMAIRHKRLMQRLQTAFAVILLAGVAVISIMAIPYIHLSSVGELYGTQAVSPLKAVTSSARPSRPSGGWNNGCKRCFPVVE